MDLEVLRSPERSQERASAERSRLRGRLLDEIYAQVRARKYAGVETALRNWFESATRDELRIDAPHILQSALAWDDARAFSTIASLCILRLHSARLIGEALDAWEAALNHDSAFLLTPVDQARELAELSGLAGRRGIARRIAARNQGE